MTKNEINEKSAAATVLTDAVRTAMARAYILGQTWWQQADSEYHSENKKADVTATHFMELTDEICAKVDTLAHAGQAESTAAAGIEGMTRYSWTFDASICQFDLRERSNGDYYRVADVERLLAQAGVTAEPARIPPEIQGMADCMVMVRQELIESGVIDATVAPMFIANAVISKLQEVAALAQVPAAEVRSAYEQAAQVVDKLAEQTDLTYKAGILKTAARDIRSLAQQSTADKASEVRAAGGNQ